MARVAQSKICASIGAGSLNEMVKKADRALSLGSDLVEFRIDTLVGAPSAAEAVRRLKRFARVAVVTVRSNREGGRFPGGEEERLGLISRLAEIDPAYLDVELATATENAEWLRSLPTKVRRIVSWHDFRGTPEIASLRSICEKELERGAVAKVVTTATKVEDNLDALRLCNERPGSSRSAWGSWARSRG
jgi:3-dehydroquinate dehydratase type I